MTRSTSQASIGVVDWTPPNGVTSIADTFAAIKTIQDPDASHATHVSITDIHPLLSGG
ncbi:MAG: hypothetical protein IIB57_05460 [Planctomycetes bacterium]|nr:hypothetical protein [Planctomycetota bacterium]